MLRAHRWPGNVRELKHVIERAIVVAEGTLIGAEHLMINQRRTGAGAVRGATTFGEIRIPADGKRLRDIEREALELTLQLTDLQSERRSPNSLYLAADPCEKAQGVRLGPMRRRTNPRRLRREAAAA